MSYRGGTRKGAIWSNCVPVAIVLPATHTGSRRTLLKIDDLGNYDETLQVKKKGVCLYYSAVPTATEGPTWEQTQVVGRRKARIISQYSVFSWPPPQREPRKVSCLA